MPLISTKTEQDIQQLVALALQTVEILAAQNAVDGQNRQRITLDAIAPQLSLQNVIVVQSVSNIAALAGWDHRQFENPANLLFNSQLSANLSFG